MLGAAWKYATGSRSGRNEDKRREAKAGEDGHEVSSITLYIVAMDKHKIDQAVRNIEEFIKDEFYSEVLN